MKNILIIDDEEAIQKSITNILSDLGFTTINCLDSRLSADYLKDNDIDLVLLDIWMPEKDGHEVLREIKSSHPDIPVIIISGHASVNTTLQVAKSGADDFIEKPFSSDVLKIKINKLLDLNIETENREADYSDKLEELTQIIDFPQKTIQESGVLKGKGLHTGTSTGIILSPLSPDSGLVFEDITTGQIIKPFVSNVDSTSFSTNLKFMDYSVTCVEHLLAVFNVYGISNISVKVNREIPIMDGSASEICSLVDKCGIKIQEKQKKVIRIDREYILHDKKDRERYISIEPYDGFSVSYTFELPGTGEFQSWEGEFTDESIEDFRREIAPARTFGFLEELKSLQSSGLGQGGDLDNFLMIKDGNVLNHKLRFDNEFARHKVLDILGDIMLMGRAVQGRIKAVKTGHRHNIALIKKILSE